MAILCDSCLLSDSVYGEAHAFYDIVTYLVAIL